MRTNPETNFNNDYDFSYVFTDEGTGEEIRLDPTNLDFFRALELVRSTKNNLFVTGKAGTGKTTFLKYVRASIPKNSVVVAFTGVAAINAGGQTLHSFFNINPSDPPFTPWDNRLRIRKPSGDDDETTIFSHFKYRLEKRMLLRSLDLLIIDEVSMIRADYIDVVDKILRAFGPQRTLPFGGVQMLLIGDPFQLPPIEGSEWEILGEFYESPFFFSSQVVNQHPLLPVELKTIYRQNEPEFVDLLNRVRVNRPLTQDLELLNKKVRPITNKDFDDNYVVLCSTNYQVNEINATRLTTLAGEEIFFDAHIDGKFPKSAFPTEERLTLKKGAQVMFLKNGSNYHNGKIGTVSDLDNGEILVELKDQRGTSSIVKVEIHTWENVEYSFNSKTKKIESKVIGTFTQYPLRLAWAITVHKSQGLTFDKVAIDINDFAPSGLTYVALSRCSSLSGLALKQPLQRQAIYTDERVIRYTEEATPESLIVELLNDGKADELYAIARKAVADGDFERAYTTFLSARELRDDMSTDIFRRYILYLLSSRKHYKSFADDMIKVHEDLDFKAVMKITELVDIARAFSGQVKEGEKQDRSPKKKIVELEEILKSMSEEKSLWTADVKKLHAELIKTSKENTTAIVSCKKLIRVNKSLRLQISDLEERRDNLVNENEYLKKEVERLSAGGEK